MSKKVTGKSKRVLRAGAPRFVLVKQTDRSWLLGGTTLFAGLIGIGLAGAPSLAVAADCTDDVNAWSCSGVGVVPLDPLTATADFFLNLDGSPLPLELTLNSATPGVRLDAAGFGGDVQVESEVVVRNSGGDGVYATNVGDVEFNIDGEFTGTGSGSADGLHIVGEDGDAEIGIFVHQDGTLNGGQSPYSEDSSAFGGYGLNVDGNDAFVYGNNDGHIQGTEAGALFADTSGVDFGNHSYSSMVGVYGIKFENNNGPINYSNGNGLTVGYGFDGVYVKNVYNQTGNNAVNINNNDAGIIVGYNSGIDIQGDVEGVQGGNGNIQINNDIYYSYEDDDNDDQTPDVLTRNDGGFIYGYSGNGILIQAGDEGELTGDVHINNGGTLGRFFDPADIEAEFNVQSGGFDVTFFFDQQFDFEGKLPYGIYGFQSGVWIDDLDGSVHINNNSRQASVWDEQNQVDVPLPNEPWISGGVIASENGYGIHIEGVGDGDEENGRVDINNGNDNNFAQAGGLIVGYGQDGVYVKNTTNDANINNARGIIDGHVNGVFFDDVASDERFVDVYNAAGSITGFTGIGVSISATDAESVNVNNWRFDDQTMSAPDHGGVIMGDDQAIWIEANDIHVGNGPGGSILGSGSWDFDNSEGEAIIDLHSDYDSDGSANVDNQGLIASWATLSDDTGHVTWEAQYDAWTVQGVPFFDIGYDIDLEAIESDVDTFAEFAWTGGQGGSLSNDGIDLADYANSASALAISAQGFDDGDTGADAHWNNWGGAIAMGRVLLDGGTFEESTSIQNLGVWYVKDLEGETLLDWQAAARLRGDGDYNGIDNAGLVQTGFDSEADETATFFVSDFDNGAYYDDGLVARYGLVSMIDGGVGDEFIVDVTELYSKVDGNYDGRGFHGSQEGDLTSFLGMDVDLSAEEMMISRSDFFTVQGDINGSTGVIFNVVQGGTTVVGDVIEVAYVDGWDRNNEDQQCYEVACVEGDTLYISDSSMNYQEVDGIGTLQDGFYSWYLTETGIAPDPEFLLVSTFSPNAVQLASLITGAQNIWYETAGVVADHVYGNHFPLDGEGGGGADLVVGEDPMAPVATAPNFAVWAKASGSWTQQDDTVTQTINQQTINIDTSFVQTTFSLLAGADYSSNPGGDGFRAGVFGGAIGSSLDFDSYNASATYTGGTVGAYGAFTSGGFYADVEGKADFLDMDYSALGIDASASVLSLGAMANAGYRMEMGGFFLEPNGTVAMLNSSIDDISAGGASVAFSDGNSLRAGAGIKLGTTLQTGELTTELAVSGKLWNEFVDANEVTVSDGLGTDVTFSDDISGAFAELRATATAYSDDRSLSAFATAGTKFNEDFTTVDGKVGVRKGF